MDIEWVCKHHSDLSKEQLYAILKLRAEVFVVEQNCAYPDVDGLDLEGDTCHLMAWPRNIGPARRSHWRPRRMCRGITGGMGLRW
jgi:predicted GNAT family N-acyltransferase